MSDLASPVEYAPALSTPIVFWSHRRRPSFTMRGLQVAEALRARGHEVRCIVGPSLWSLRGVRDSIVVCVKSVPRLLAELRRRGNRVVFDAIDLPFSAAPPDADAVLCASQYVAERVAASAPNRRIEVFYHHADPRILPNTAPSNRPHLVYVGEKKNSAFLTGQLPELAFVDFKRPAWEVRIRAYNVHFSARLDPCKSVVKLANSAAADAIFLTGPEPGVVELLGADYPFFFEPSAGIEEARRAVRFLDEAFLTERWHKALSRVRALKDRLSLDASAAQYETLFRTLA